MDENKEVIKKNKKGIVPILLIIAIALLVMCGYLLWDKYYDVDLNTSNNTDNSQFGQNKNSNTKEEQNTEMTAQWFEEYLSPLLININVKANKGTIDLKNAVADDKFKTGFNLSISTDKYVKDENNIFVKESDIAYYVEKYFGEKDFSYNKDFNDMIIYNSTKKEYATTLEFAFINERPVAEYIVVDVTYKENIVTLNLLLDYKGAINNEECTVTLNCIKEICSVSKLVLN